MSFQFQMAALDLGAYHVGGLLERTFVKPRPSLLIPQTANDLLFYILTCAESILKEAPDVTIKTRRGDLILSVFACVRS